MFDDKTHVYDQWRGRKRFFSFVDCAPSCCGRVLSRVPVNTTLYYSIIIIIITIMLCVRVLTTPVHWKLTSSYLLSSPGYIFFFHSFHTAACARPTATVTHAPRTVIELFFKSPTRNSSANCVKTYQLGWSETERNKKNKSPQQHWIAIFIFPKQHKQKESKHACKTI